MRRKPQRPKYQNGDSGRTRFQNGAGMENLFLGIKVTVLSDVGPQPLQPREKEAWLLLQLAATLGIIHKGICRMREFWDCKGFHLDFRRRPGRPGSVPLRGQFVKVCVRSLFGGKPRSLEKPGMWIMQRGSKAGLRGKPWKLPPRVL